jgi:hypothetical protein
MIAATAEPNLENILGLRVRRRRHDGQPPLQQHKTWGYCSGVALNVETAVNTVEDYGERTFE